MWRLCSNSPLCCAPGATGAYVDCLNVVRERPRKEVITLVKDAAYGLLRVISTVKGTGRVWYDALEDVASLLASFYRTSSKRMRWLLRKGGMSCFSCRTGVQWVEAVFHELDVVLENSPAVVLHLPEYIDNEADLGRREKAEGLLETLSHPLFKLTAGFFCDVFVVVCATNKKVQATKGAQTAEVRGLMNTCAPSFCTPYVM